MALAFWLGAVCGGSAAAQDKATDPPPVLTMTEVETGRVAAVTEAGHLRLDDGRVLVLAPLQMPLEPFPGASPGPRDWLAAQLLGQSVAFDPATVQIDRYGRLEAQLRGPGGAWLQDAMLRRGLARVVGFEQPEPVLEALLAAEAAGRRAALGLWTLPAYRPLPADRAEPGVGRFQVVEGLVRDAAVVRGRTYLNFGSDWRSDFTVVIAPRDRRRFAAAARSADRLEGRRIRVRGWLESFNGPMIEVGHPLQIELLAE